MGFLDCLFGRPVFSIPSSALGSSSSASDSSSVIASGSSTTLIGDGSVSAGSDDTIPVSHTVAKVSSQLSIKAKDGERFDLQGLSFSSVVVMAGDAIMVSSIHL